MASLTIRNLDENVKKALRLRAAERGVSMEEAARLALAHGVTALSKPRKSAEEIMAWVRAQPKGEPLDSRYATLDHKTLSDMISDGEA
jgi:antitoxin FitA